MSDDREHALRNLHSQNEALKNLLARAKSHIEELLAGSDEARLGKARRFVNRLEETEFQPAAAPQANKAAPEREDEPAPAADNLLTGKAILVVEDEKLVGMSLKVVLLDLGASEVRICSQFEACRAMIKNVFQPHAALVDLDIAGRDARPIARELRELDIPFVFHTGSEEDGELRAEFGDIPVLRKPAPVADIARALAKVLD